MKHEIKCWPEPFQAIWDGLKTCEFRYDDRNYAVDDELRLREYYPAGLDWPGKYTGRELLVRVTDIRGWGQFGIPNDYVMMSFWHLSRTP
jgi:hypothetical protein